MTDGNIGSGNDLLPDGTKSLLKLMLTSHLLASVAFTVNARATLLQDEYENNAFKILPHFEGDNALMQNL